jgi:homoserine kinase
VFSVTVLLVSSVSSVAAEVEERIRRLVVSVGSGSSVAAVVAGVVIGGNVQARWLESTSKIRSPKNSSEFD